MKPCEERRCFPEDEAASVYIHHIDEDGFLWVMLMSELGVMESISTTLNEINHITLEDPTVDKVVSALNNDNTWYRACILSTEPNYRVRFIDYGDTAEVAKNNLAPLPEPLSEIHPLAMKVKLPTMTKAEPSIGSTLLLQYIDHVEGIVMVDVVFPEFGTYSAKDCIKSQELSTLQPSLAENDLTQGTENEKPSSYQDSNQTLPSQLKLETTADFVSNTSYCRLDKIQEKLSSSLLKMKEPLQSENYLIPQAIDQPHSEAMEILQSGTEDTSCKSDGLQSIEREPISVVCTNQQENEMSDISSSSALMKEESYIPKTFEESNSQLPSVYQTTDDQCQIQGINESVVRPEELYVFNNDDVTDDQCQIQGINESLVRPEELHVFNNDDVTDDQCQIQGINESLVRPEELHAFNNDVTDDQCQIQGINESLVRPEDVYVFNNDDVSNVKENLTVALHVNQNENGTTTLGNNASCTAASGIPATILEERLVVVEAIGTELSCVDQCAVDQVLDKASDASYKTVKSHDTYNEEILVGAEDCSLEKDQGTSVLCITMLKKDTTSDSDEALSNLTNLSSAETVQYDETIKYAHQLSTDGEDSVGSDEGPSGLLTFNQEPNERSLNSCQGVSNNADSKFEVVAEESSPLLSVATATERQISIPDCNVCEVKSNTSGSSENGALCTDSSDIPATVLDERLLVSEESNPLLSCVDSLEEDLCDSSGGDQILIKEYNDSMVKLQEQCASFDKDLIDVQEKPNISLYVNEISDSSGNSALYPDSSDIPATVLDERLLVAEESNPLSSCVDSLEEDQRLMVPNSELFITNQPHNAHNEVPLVNAEDFPLKVLSEDEQENGKILLPQTEAEYSCEDIDPISSEEFSSTLACGSQLAAKDNQEVMCSHGTDSEVCSEAEDPGHSSVKQIISTEKIPAQTASENTTSCTNFLSPEDIVSAHISEEASHLPQDNILYCSQEPRIISEVGSVETSSNVLRTSKTTEISTMSFMSIPTNDGSDSRQEFKAILDFELSILREQNRLQMLALQKKMEEHVSNQINGFQKEVSRQFQMLFSDVNGRLQFINDTVVNKLADMYSDITMLKNDNAISRVTNPGEHTAQFGNNVNLSVLNPETPSFNSHNQQAQQQNFNNATQKQPKQPGMKNTGPQANRPLLTQVSDYQSNCGQNINQHQPHNSVMSPKMGHFEAGSGIAAENVNPNKFKSKIVLVNNLNLEKVNFDHIFNLFGLYGEVHLVKINKGLGFVEMATENQANEVISYLNRVPLMGNQLNLSFSKFQFISIKKEDTECKNFKDYTKPVLKNQNRKGNIPIGKSPSNCLRINNILNTVSDEKIKEMFSKHGFEITRIKTVRVTDEKMKAYVSFKTVAEAVDALAVMHLKELSDWVKMRIDFGK